MSKLICDSKAAALTVLSSIADVLDNRTLKESLKAVLNYVNREVSDFIPSEELTRRIEKIFEQTEGEKKFDAWINAGSYKDEQGEYVPYQEPESGAEGLCRYDSDKKIWEPTHIPHWILPKTDSLSNNGDQE